MLEMELCATPKALHASALENSNDEYFL